MSAGLPVSDDIAAQLHDAALVHRARVEISAAAEDLRVRPLDEAAAVRMTSALTGPTGGRARAAYRRLVGGRR